MNGLLLNLSQKEIIIEVGKQSTNQSEHSRFRTTFELFEACGET